MCLRFTVSCKDRKISNRNGNLALVVQKGGKHFSGNKSIDFDGIYLMEDYNFIYLSFEQLGPGVQEHNSSLKRLNRYRSKRAFLSFKMFLVIAIKVSTTYPSLYVTQHMGEMIPSNRTRTYQHLKFNELLWSDLQAHVTWNGLKTTLVLTMLHHLTVFWSSRRFLVFSAEKNDKNKKKKYKTCRVLNNSLS